MAEVQGKRSQTSSCDRELFRIQFFFRSFPDVKLSVSRISPIISSDHSFMIRVRLSTPSIKCPP